MPKNIQAQVKMTPKPQSSPAARDASALASGLTNDSLPISKNGAHVRTSRIVRDFPAVESKCTPAPQQVCTPELQQLATRRERGYLFAKRSFDLALGSVLLIIAAPIVLCAALAIRIDTPGSPFFFQTRLGKNGRPFKIFKLRGMYRDARTRFPTYYDYSHKRDLEFCFHHEADPRVTRAGRFIRRTSVDELPNLWNVVMGDMSLVGPRPEIPEVLALYGPYRDQYLSVKPGITCLSKITGRDKLTKRETISFDLEYIRTRSFKYDFLILWRTIRSVLMRRDVF